MAQTTGAPKKVSGTQTGTISIPCYHWCSLCCCHLKVPVPPVSVLFNRERPGCDHDHELACSRCSGRHFQQKGVGKTLQKAESHNGLLGRRFWQVGSQACATLYFGKRTPLSMDLPPPKGRSRSCSHCLWDGLCKTGHCFSLSFLVVILVQSPSPRLSLCNLVDCSLSWLLCAYRISQARILSNAISFSGKSLPTRIEPESPHCSRFFTAGAL